MQLKHTKPCNQCPWRKDSPQGWLGGYSPELYADAVDNNEVPACHLQDKGPDDNKTAMCAGALATMYMQCKSAYNTPGGDEARKVVGLNIDCFSNVYEFYKYHAGKDYKPAIFRLLSDMNKKHNKSAVRKRKNSKK